MRDKGKPMAGDYADFAFGFLGMGFKIIKSADADIHLNPAGLAVLDIPKAYAFIYRQINKSLNRKSQHTYSNISAKKLPYLYKHILVTFLYKLYHKIKIVSIPLKYNQYCGLPRFFFFQFAKNRLFRNGAAREI